MLLHDRLLTFLSFPFFLSLLLSLYSYSWGIAPSPATPSPQAPRTNSASGSAPSSPSHIRTRQQTTCCHSTTRTSTSASGRQTTLRSARTSSSRASGRRWSWGSLWGVRRPCGWLIRRTQICIWVTRNCMVRWGGEGGMGRGAVRLGVWRRRRGRGMICELAGVYICHLGLGFGLIMEMLLLL